MSWSDRFLARVGSGGALPPWASRLLGPATGLSQILTTPAAAKALLELPDVTVPYGERSRLLGIGGFPLGLDGPAHEKSRRRVEQALASSGSSHRDGVSAARTSARERVAAASERIDLIDDLIDPALHTWIETWYGLEGWGLRLARAGRLLQHATFLNPMRPSGRTDFTALRFAIDDLERTALNLAIHLATKPPAAGTVAAALLASVDDDPELTASLLLGLSVGPLALGSMTIAIVLDDLLDRSWELDGLVPGPGETSEAAEKRASHTFAAVLARRPPLGGVLRCNPEKRTVPAGPLGVMVPEGEILVATSCAMAMEGADDSTLAFGWGRHACLGRTAITEVAGPVLVAAAARSPRRRPGTEGRLRNALGPTAIPTWPFPGHLDGDLLS